MQFVPISVQKYCGLHLTQGVPAQEGATSSQAAPTQGSTAGLPPSDRRCSGALASTSSGRGAASSSIGVGEMEGAGGVWRVLVKWERLDDGAPEVHAWLHHALGHLHVA